MNRPSENRPRLVVVAPWVYHPNCGMGGGVLCFYTLQALAATHDIFFLSPDETPNDLGGGKVALRAFCKEVITVCPVTLAVGRSRFAQILALLQVRLSGWIGLLTRGAPREVQRDYNAPLSMALRRLVAQADPHLVILQFPPMAHFVADVQGVPTVIDVQDVNMVSRYRRWRVTEGVAARIVNGLGWWAWARYELRWYARATALLALSETDQGVLRAFLPSVPCYLSPVATTPQVAARSPVGYSVGLIGNFHHKPNRDGFDWMLSEVWPIVCRSVPEAVLRVAGPGSPEADTGLRAKGVEALGFVEDVDRFFSEVTLAIVPYRFGGGVKIKALEAMARGCPVVTTTIGAEGLRAATGLHLVVADGAGAFAQAIVELLRSPARARAMGEAGQLHVSHHFSWQTKTDALVDVLSAISSNARIGQTAA